MIQGQLNSPKQLNVRQHLYVMHISAVILFAVMLRLKKETHVVHLARTLVNKMVESIRVVSSVGRASALHAECRQFEPVTTHQDYEII